MRRTRLLPPCPAVSAGRLAYGRSRPPLRRGLERAPQGGMCLLGVLAERPRPFAKWLGPESLARLSRGQVDGWGVSGFARDRTWSSQRFEGSGAGHALVTST